VTSAVPFSSRVIVPDTVLFRELDNESVILDLATDAYMGLDDVGTRMWMVLISEPSVQAAIDSLRGPALVIESSGGRVPRYAHNLGKVLQLPSQSIALLTALMLRGPQTAGELRINCERLHRFADISAVEGFLQELAERPDGAMVAELPRLPGARENRWAHLLSGAPDLEEMTATATRAVSGPVTDASVGEIAALKANLARLEDEVAGLKALVSRLCAELGVSG